MNFGEYFKISVISFFLFILFVYSWEFKLYLKDLDYLNNIEYEIDYRKPIKIFKDSKNIDENTVMVSNHFKDFMEKPNLSIFPTSGISKKPTIHCNENGYYSKYISDRYGFNNNDEVWDKNKIDYIFLGDSFIHGACVNREDNISSKFKSLSKNKNLNVVNLGYSGSGPLIQLINLKEYSIENNIKNIFWFYFEGGDLADLENEIKNKILNNYVIKKNFIQNLKKKQINIDDELKKYLKIKYDEISNKNYEDNHKINRELKLRFFKLYRLREKFSTYYRYDAPENQNFEKIVKLINNFASDRNINLYFVFLPQKERYLQFFFKDKKNYVLEIVKNNKVKIIDIDNLLFKKNSDPLNFFPFRFENHYNELGYHSIAKILNDHIN